MLIDDKYIDDSFIDYVFFDHKMGLMNIHFTYFSRDGHTEVNFQSFPCSHEEYLIHLDKLRDRPVQCVFFNEMYYNIYLIKKVRYDHEKKCMRLYVQEYYNPNVKYLTCSLEEYKKNLESMRKSGSLPSQFRSLAFRLSRLFKRKYSTAASV